MHRHLARDLCLARVGQRAIGRAHVGEFGHAAIFSACLLGCAADLSEASRQRGMERHF